MISALMWFQESHADNTARQTLQCGGMVMEYSENEGRAILTRVISTDPSSYLDSRYQPGADITHLTGRM